MKILTLIGIAWWYTAAVGPNPGSLGPVSKFGPFLNSSQCAAAVQVLAKEGGCSYDTNSAYNIFTQEQEPLLGRQTVCFPKKQVYWPTGQTCWKGN